MKAYWGSEGMVPRIDIGTRWEWSASSLGRFSPREKAPGMHFIGGWVGPIAGLDAVERRKIPSPYWDSNLRSSSP
jgi:hypothetical protein